MKIILDAFGGDSPEELIKGAAESINAFSDLSLVITGDEKLIAAELAKYRFDSNRIEIVHCKEVITNEDSPTEVIRQKRDSSMVRAFEICKERDDVAGMITTGNTGAALAGGTFLLGRLPGVRRLTLCTILPTMTGRRVCILDCGANVDCHPEFLAQFAVMGSAYMTAVFGIENPRVALVSNGTEDKKGNELTRAAFPLLKELPINFVGNMEAFDAISGKYDVLVCDGFVGNVLLKCVEGTVSGLLGLIKTTLKTSGLKAKIGGALVKPALKKMMKEKINEDEMGGSAFLGCNKLLTKAHGSSDALKIKGAVMQMMKMVEGGLVEKIKQSTNRPE